MANKIEQISKNQLDKVIFWLNIKSLCKTKKRLLKSKCKQVSIKDLHQLNKLQKYCKIITKKKIVHLLTKILKSQNLSKTQEMYTLRWITTTIMNIILKINQKMIFFSLKQSIMWDLWTNVTKVSSKILLKLMEFHSIL